MYSLFYEIKLCESLDSHLINKIDDAICRQHTDFMQLNNLKLNCSCELRVLSQILKNNLQDLMYKDNFFLPQSS